MFMGLTGPFEQGMTFPLVLVFEKAGEITVDVTVDLERQDAMDHGMDHGKMDHGSMDHGKMTHTE
jgi:copper(I)-binding protein